MPARRAQGGTAATVLTAALIAIAAMLGTARAADAAVVLNEVECSTDYIELVNTSAGPADISGWLLTDDPITTVRPDHRYLFGPSTTIPGEGRIVVFKGATGFPFGISCGNDTIRLADASEALLDEFTVPALPSEAASWGRVPDGSGAWVGTFATPGNQNEAADGELPDVSWLYDPAAVAEIDLGLSPDALAALDAGPEEYVTGSFSLEVPGEPPYVLAQVGIRLKGGTGSFRPLSGKSAFKVRFAHAVPGQRFFGLRNLTLNNMVQDPSMLHETLSYETFRAAGVPAPRTGYAFVRVNGSGYGVYLNVETMDQVALERWFATTRHLFEGEYGADATAARSAELEVNEGSGSDLSDLEALVAAVEDTAGTGLPLSQRVAGLADLAEMTRMWAAEKYVGHWDGYAGATGLVTLPNNYYLHSDSSGLFSMLPWGTDLTWMDRLDFSKPGGALFNQCLADPACESMYRAAVAGVRDVARGLPLDELAAGTAAMLAPWQAQDPRREQPVDQIEVAVAEARAFIAARPGDVNAWLGSPPGPAPAEPALRTAITKQPRDGVEAGQVELRFRANDPGASFQCRLDKRAFRSCSSPKRFAVRPGRHAFKVRAVGSTGEIELTPAVARFEAVRG